MNSKEKIIMATLELACANGLRSVSMPQIAEKAGIKKSTLYSHFSSKEEIITKMYTFLRTQANQNREIGTFDYGSYVEGKSLKEILMGTVISYDRMNRNPQMEMFYKVIISEKTLNPIAAEIMVTETNTMIGATKQLFYAIMAKKVAFFENIDAAAVSFAMGIHAILDFRLDDGIHTNDVSKVIARNKQKTDNLYRLRSCGNIWGVPYRVYYMSCNLDHVLYDKRNSTDEEKENDAYVRITKRMK